MLDLCRKLARIAITTCDLVVQLQNIMYTLQKQKSDFHFLSLDNVRVKP